MCKGGEGGEKKGQVSIFSDCKSLNRFHPNVTFIISEQLISLDKTGKKKKGTVTPTVLFRRWTERRGMKGARADTGQPSDAPGIAGRVGERKVLYFKKLLLTCGHPVWCLFK